MAADSNEMPWAMTGAQFSERLLRALPLVLDAVGEPPESPSFMTWLSWLAHQIEGELDAESRPTDPPSRSIEYHIVGDPRPETAAALLSIMRKAYRDVAPGAPEQ